MSTLSTPSSEINTEQEEGARADMYGLLATLYFDAPSAELLQAIGQAQPQGDSLLGQAWDDLSEACRNMDAAQVRDEYQKLFIGVSKPEILPYGSYYLSGFLMEKPLAELRADLEKLGLSRPDGVSETEDHVASLFEVMRILILSAEPGEEGLAAQKHFYSMHIRPWIEQLCDALDNHPQAVFYKRISGLTRRFVEIENQAFEMS